jgi:hypothetical protein
MTIPRALDMTSRPYGSLAHQFSPAWPESTGPSSEALYEPAMSTASPSLGVIAVHGPKRTGQAGFCNVR